MPAVLARIRDTDKNVEQWADGRRERIAVCCVAIPASSSSSSSGGGGGDNDPPTHSAWPSRRQPPWPDINHPPGHLSPKITYFHFTKSVLAESWKNTTNEQQTSKQRRGIHNYSCARSLVNFLSNFSHVSATNRWAYETRNIVESIRHD